MNRVRVVAVTAVALGVAVIAGTQFQKSQELGALGTQSSSLQPTVLPEVQTASVLPGVADAAVGDTQAAPSLVSSASGERPVSLLPSRIAVAEAPRPAEPQAPVVLTTASILSAADLLPAAGTVDTVEMAQATGIAPAVAAPLDPELQAELAACAVWIVVTPAAGAMLDASVYAPCDRDAQVQVSHAGLSFDTHIGADGQLALMVPALIDDATLTVTFADGRTQSDRTFVQDLSSVERVALQWNAPAALTLHAYEFGAQYGEAGHVFSGNAQVPGADDHGFLTDLGDASIVGGHRVQVYSYPSGQSSRSGAVTLEIEVPITPDSCGKPLVADSIEMYGAAPARSRVIELDMPACDGTGGYVVLPGILPDLQIAALR